MDLRIEIFMLKLDWIQGTSYSVLKILFLHCIVVCLQFNPCCMLYKEFSTKETTWLTH